MKIRFVLPLLAALLVPAAARAQSDALQSFGSEGALRRFLRGVQPDAPPPAPPVAPTPAPVPPPPPPSDAVTQIVPGQEFAVVTGRVTGPQGTPEPGVLVRMEALNLGAATTAEGEYRLMVPHERFQPGQTVQVSAARIGLGTVVRTLTLLHSARVTQHFTVAPAEIALENIVVAGVATALQGTVAGASITNTQHAGVDEGGIVKAHGDYLVILRRGRLFTVDVGGGRLRPVDAINAYAPEALPGDYYDEMLISGDNVLVLGYNYHEEATEINLFSIDGRGRLRHRSTYHLRSDDYYSSGNYATRLLGNTLVLYTPYYLPTWYEEPAEWMPGIHRWRSVEEFELDEDGFRRILPAARIFRPGRPVDEGDDLVLHTVTTCRIARGELDCEASAVLGPDGRVFYVSPNAVYVWVSDWSADAGSRSSAMLYRMPLDGGRPTALGVEGSPVDQFSFLESEDRHLNVVVRDEGGGDGMWRAEWPAGEMRLLRVPLARFGGGRREAPRSAYRPLPLDGEADDSFHNRFVGGHLLYGMGAGWGSPRAGGATLHAVPWRGGPAAALPMAHGIDRIEVMGADAVVVGADTADLHFTGIRLGRAPRVSQRYVHAGASQGETRSHGFFYRQDGPDEGVIGLPIAGPGRPGFAQLYEGSGAVLYLRNAGDAFREMGELVSQAESVDDEEDGCETSCDDWYGNARPVFLGGRVFALLGYEIVEGTMDDGRIREVARANFTPRAEQAASR